MNDGRDAKKAEILNALKQVAAPDLGSDVVSLGCVKNVTFCDGAVSADLVLPVPAGPVQAELEQEARRAMGALPWVSTVNLSVTSEISATPNAKEDNPLSRMKNIIAVASGKGGVGKSTVAVNLAAALVRAGVTVGLLDADIYGPSIPTMLGAKGVRPAGIKAPDGRNLLDPVLAHGIKLMSMGFLVEEDRPVIWRGPMLHGALKQFFGDVAWGELDYLVVDLPPGTGDIALSMAQSITLTGAVVVSTPQEVAMVDARKAVNMFKETGIHLLGVVENMSGEIFGAGEVESWARKESFRFLGSLPLEAGTRKSGDAGVPAALSKDPAVSGPFTALARHVASACALRNAEAPARKPISIER